MSVTAQLMIQFGVLAVVCTPERYRGVGGAVVILLVGLAGWLERRGGL